MRYVPHTDNEKSEMLSAIGLKSVHELFSDVDKSIYKKELLALPLGISEAETYAQMSDISALNHTPKAFFLGAGIYRHYIPSVVPHLASRSEFYTAYTPYQAEMSQGMLTAIFEYQSMICRLTGMDVSNASLYDGATAAAEAAFLAVDTTKRKKVSVLRSVHPDTIEVLKTYCHTRGYVLNIVDFGEATGVCCKEDLAAKMENSACIIAQNPNFFGLYEDMAAIGEIAHQAGALFVASVNPISLGIVASPAQYAADVAIGEGQPLGIPMNFGGPGFGFFASTTKLTRRIPGRIVGKTADGAGCTAYVLTLQAREQHIRREKAFSNICSNQSLAALTGSIYLSALSAQGLKEVATSCILNAGALEQVLLETGFTMKFNGSAFFHELVVESKCSGDVLQKALAEKGIAGGLSLEKQGAFFKNCTLWCATEMTTAKELDILRTALTELKEEGIL